MMRAAAILIVLLCAAAASTAQEPGSALLIRASRVIPVEGEAFEGGGEVLIQDGRIKAIGRALEAPTGAHVLSFQDGVIFPGFVDGACHVGVRRQRDEIARSALPELRIADAFDAGAEAVADAVCAGITTVHLVSGDANVVGGRTAIAKISPSGEVNWLKREAGHKLSFVEDAYVRGREPTSLQGGLQIAKRLHAGNAFVVAGDDEPPLFVSARTPRQVAVAARCSELFGRNGVLYVPPSALDAIELLRGRCDGILLYPLLPEASDRERARPVQLAAAGVPFGFASEAPLRPPAALRLSAITARMSGLSEAEAEAALTIVPARLLGISDRVGSLLPGKDADLLVLSHGPTDPRARILLVVQDGQLVYRGETVEGGAL